MAVKFKNLSTNANSFVWTFGDNTSSILFEPVHEYNKTGNYQVTLFAYNNLICTDTFNLLVDVIINPLLICVFFSLLLIYYNNMCNNLITKINQSLFL